MFFISNQWKIQATPSEPLFVRAPLSYQSWFQQLHWRLSSRSTALFIALLWLNGSNPLWQQNGTHMNINKINALPKTLFDRAAHWNFAWSNCTLLSKSWAKNSALACHSCLLEIKGLCEIPDLSWSQLSLGNWEACTGILAISQARVEFNIQNQR